MTLMDSGPLMLRIYKRKMSNPAIVWANTYEFMNTEANTSGSLTILANDIVNAESELHLDDTQFVRAIVSTWVPDGEPYNPLSFMAIPLTAVGKRPSAGTEAMPLQICLRVAFKTEFGRQGFRLYRNCLAESDVSSPSGVPTLTWGGPTTFLTNFYDGFTDYFRVSDPPFLALVSAGNTRVVTSIVAAGVTVKKFNNRYFDKGL